MLSKQTSNLKISQLTASEVLSQAQKIELDPLYAKKWAEEMARGDISLLVASVEGSFAGRVAVVWRQPDEPEIAQQLPGVPTIMAAEVTPNMQSQGIGTKLMQAAERLVCERGKTQLALGVALDNPRAIKFYQRLGYQDWGHGDIVISWTELDKGGNRIEINETCHVMVKEIVCQK